MENAISEITSLKDEMTTVQYDVSTIKSDYAAVSNKVADVENSMVNTNTAVATLQSQNVMYAKAIKSLQIDNVKRDYRSMQFNVILNNVVDNQDESDEECLQLVNNVLRDVFKVNNYNIRIAVAHRLGKKNVNGRRPIIFKLADLKQKQTLWKNIANITVYNDANPTQKVFVEMTQIPKKLGNDKKSLADDYFKAKNAGQNPKWRFDQNKGQFCYVIGTEWFRPKIDFFAI